MTPRTTEAEESAHVGYFTIRCIVSRHDDDALSARDPSLHRGTNNDLADINIGRRSIAMAAAIASGESAIAYKCVPFRVDDVEAGDG